jgi:hypothetical protein
VPILIPREADPFFRLETLFRPGKDLLDLTWGGMSLSSSLTQTTVYQPRILANISGAQIVASDSMTNFGVSAASLPHVIFSFGTAPEYEP